MATRTEPTPDPLAELRNLMDKPVTDWKPEKAGDRVLGIVVELTEVDGQHSRFPVVTLDVGDALARVACGRSVLESEIRSRDIREGDQLGIIYEGEKLTVNGAKTYHSYRVVHRPASRTEPPRIASAPTVANEPSDDEGFDLDDGF